MNDAPPNHWSKGYDNDDSDFPVGLDDKPDLEVIKKQMASAMNLARKMQGSPELLSQAARQSGLEAEIEGANWRFTSDEGLNFVTPRSPAEQASKRETNWKEAARELALKGVISDIDKMQVSKRNLLMGHIIVRQKLTVMGASGGLGKSTFAVALCMAAASGQEMFGVKCHEGPMKVAYFSTEDELDEIQRLAKAAAAVNNMRTSIIKDRMSVFGQDQIPTSANENDH